MPEVTRRQFVIGLFASAGLVGASSAIAMSQTNPPLAAKAPPPPIGAAPLLPPPPTTARIPLPGGGELTRIPGQGDLLALTVDDGVDSEVVRLYTQLAKDTGIRLTFFVNGVYDSWRDNAALLRPLVDSGQIQLGNHTWSHPDLTTLSKDQVADQLQRNDRFLRSTFGADATPYFRPPYGNHNDAVDAVAAAVLGIHPARLATLRLAESAGLGVADLGRIEIVGDFAPRSSKGSGSIPAMHRPARNAVPFESQSLNQSR